MKKLAPLYAGAMLAALVALIGAFALLRPSADKEQASVPTVSLFGGAAPQTAGSFGAGLHAAPLSAEAPAGSPAGPSIGPELPRQAPPEGFEEYRSERHGFSFYYEAGARVREFDEGRGAMSLTVEDEKRGHALQIYILPYGEATISEERFRSDLPSGIRTDEEMIEIYGVPAVAFKSEVSLLGPTREVWLLRDGYLYEISTPLSMEGWLQGLLPGFRFF